MSAGPLDGPAPERGVPRVVVIGVGLIGASIGSALTAQGWPVHLRDAKSSHARVAETLGAGSLTTPPCSESVTWTVMTQPVAVSDEAIGAFAALFANDARPLQPVNDRTLLTN